MAERTNSQMLGATLLGGMIGAGLALLLAPRSGRETREQISDNLMNLKDGTNQKLSEAKSKVRKGVEEAKDLKSRLADAAHNTGKKAKAEMDELKSDSKIKSRRQSPVLTAWEEEV